MTGAGSLHLVPDSLAADTSIPVRSFLALPLIFAIGAATGLGSAYFVVRGDPAFGAVQADQWVTWPDLGSIKIDPYALATLARSARIPLASGEGFAFTARTDEAGRPLDSTCRYSLSGHPPRARAWTLTVYDAHGELADNPLQRNGFTSRELTHSADGSISINLAREATAGDWLPLPPTRAFTVVLRLYDTALSPTAGSISTISLPILKRTAC
ncbi:conserved hypothetical protein [Chelatococcus asaccharovorans]|nr:conserved hypothetical protein [Chelatococcus asaccharovorans]CAH1677514.1 conserved hypothetical protein [Chelatococcus asaccharovorans]